MAGILYKLMPALFNTLGISADAALIVFGVALLHVIITAPRGIAGQVGDALAHVVAKGASR